MKLLVHSLLALSISEKNFDLNETLLIPATLDVVTGILTLLVLTEHN